MCERCTKLRAASFTPMAQRQQQLSHAPVHLGMSSSSVFTFGRAGFFTFTVKWLFCFQAAAGTLVPTWSDAVRPSNAVKGYFHL